MKSKATIKKINKTIKKESKKIQIIKHPKIAKASKAKTVKTVHVHKHGKGCKCAGNHCAKAAALKKKLHKSEKKSIVRANIRATKKSKKALHALKKAHMAKSKLKAA